VIGRHIRLAGLRLIQEKLAEGVFTTPSLSSLKGLKTKELGGKPPDNHVPKIVTLPSS
jgi:hypothetical protein